MEVHCVIPAEAGIHRTFVVAAILFPMTIRFSEMAKTLSGIEIAKGEDVVNVLFIITTDDGETIYNAMRLANVGVEKGDEVSVFMLG